MITRRLRIHGRVQGVGYRAWAAEAARARGLAGWVRNRADGSVEALAVGDADAVAAFVGDCRRGPPAARVERIDPHEETVPEVTGFAVLPTPRD